MSRPDLARELDAVHRHLVLLTALVESLAVSVRAPQDAPEAEALPDPSAGRRDAGLHLPAVPGRARARSAAVTTWTGPRNLGPGVLGAVTLESGETFLVTMPEPGRIGLRVNGREIALPIPAAREVAAFALIVTGSDADLLETLDRLRRAFATGAVQ